jgi:cytochrome bd ubiquinol oxidase subunit II
MIFQIIWFILWGTLWAVYFMADGFDLGAGMLQSFIGKNEGEKKTIIRTFSPFWNGNEVWLITAGGATFAAFPTTYALMFSYLYTALLLILFALIIRGVSIEFRNKAENAKWKKAWDFLLLLGSFLIALLFGVAFGNIFEGLPMDADGYHGTLLTLLNPYGILTGVFFVLTFILHGSLWLAIKIDGELRKRASSVANKTWYAVLVIAVAFLFYTAFATKLYANYLEYPIWFIVPIVAVLALVGTKVFMLAGKNLHAFYSSCLTIITVVFTGIIGLYPNLIPSSIDSKYSLTIFNSSSSPYTLKIMTIVAFIFVPIVIAYQVWVYVTFRKKLTVDEVIKDTESY